jgi:hypothetical protein
MIAFILDCCIFLVFFSHAAGSEVEDTHEAVNAMSKIVFVAGWIVADLYLLCWCLYQQTVHLPSLRKGEKPTVSSAMTKAIVMGNTVPLGVAWDQEKLRNQQKDVG